MELIERVEQDIKNGLKERPIGKLNANDYLAAAAVLRIWAQQIEDKAKKKLKQAA